MLKLFSLAQAYLTKEDGATAIEYGLIAAGISLGIVASVFAFGDDLEAVFDAMQGSLDGAADNIESVN